MGLKDDIASDIDAFLDTGEFAEEYEITMGSITATVTAVLDEDSNAKATVSESEGIYAVSKKLHVREADLPRPPVVGKTMKVNDMDYLISNISREMGLMVLTLEVYDSGG